MRRLDLNTEKMLAHVDDGVGWITFNQPEKRNAVSLAMWQAIPEIIDDFASALSEADVTIVLEVYAAGEAAIAGADGRAIARAVRSRGAIEPVFVDTLDELLPVLADLIEDGDLVLTMGAGDIGAYAAGLPDLLRSRPSLKVHS